MKSSSFRAFEQDFQKDFPHITEPHMIGFQIRPKHLISKRNITLNKQLGVNKVSKNWAQPKIK